LEARDAPLLVHPGPGLGYGPNHGTGPSLTSCLSVGETSLNDPLWGPALTRYVAEIQAAWLAFVSIGRAEHPRLRVIFSMLAGLAPLHAERLCSRGGPAALAEDPLSFYETSSYGPAAVGQMAAVVGPEQLLYGSDRPVADPTEHAIAERLDWDAIGEASRRALGEPAGSASSGRLPASVTVP
jgi:hypothetical protein